MYCVDFETPSESWISHPGTFEGMTSGDACGRAWVVMLNGEYQSLLSNQSSSPPATSQFTVEEVAALKYQASNPSPFNLSIPDGTLVSGAIVGTWALAWVLKQFRLALNTDGEKESS